MELKKTWKGFVWWMIGYVAALFGVIFLPTEDEGLLIRLVLGMTVLAMAVLTWMILKTGCIYWYNGVSYEEAAGAGAQRREDYARAHFNRFRMLALVCLVFSTAAHLLGISYWFDFALCTMGMIGTAVSTMRIKL